MRIIKWLQSQLPWLIDTALDKLQNACDHPGNMVAADVLRGASVNFQDDASNLQVQWCRRCGAVKVVYGIREDADWQVPDPHLWRDFRKESKV